MRTTDGNRIFVTGGASGLGFARAKRFGAAGYRFCIGDVNDTRGAEAEKARADKGVDAKAWLPHDVFAPIGIRADRFLRKRMRKKAG